MQLFFEILFLAAVAASLGVLAYSIAERPGTPSSLRAGAESVALRRHVVELPPNTLGR